MEVDPLTRREADKIEFILQELIHDLEIVSLLPEEFNLWTRDDVVSTVESQGLLQQYEEYLTSRPKSPTQPDEENARRLASLLPAIPAALSANGGSAPAEVPLTIDEEEERQQVLKASCFVHTAAQYGDPADIENNEAVLQVSDYGVVERNLLESANHTGSVDASQLQYHHLSTRALMDTLRDGGYTEAVTFFLRKFYGAPGASGVASLGSPTSSLRGDGTERGGGTESTVSSSSAAPIMDSQVNRMITDVAYRCGAVDEGVDHLRLLLCTLHRLIQQRNASTVNEDIHRYELLHDAVNRSQAGIADVQLLNLKYMEVKEARRKEVAALDKEISDLEEELRYTQRSADVELEALHRVNEAIQEEHRQALLQQLTSKRHDAADISRRLRQVQLKNADELNALRTLRTKREAAVSVAISEYDGESETMLGVIHKLTKAAEEDTENILLIEEEVQKLRKEKDEHEWEQHVATQRSEHASVIRQSQEHDARVLQAYCRAYMARVNAEKNLKKKKKKKGGKKGGKKKSTV